MPKMLFFLSSFCNVSSRVTVDQQENLAFSLLMFHLLPLLSLILLFLSEASGFIYQTATKRLSAGLLSNNNKQDNDSYSGPPSLVYRILEGCQRCVLAVVCAHAHIPGVVSLHIWSSSSQVCVHCRRFLHVHTLTHTHKEKKTKPISLFQTHQ